MSILGFIGAIFKPAVDLIDSLHVSDEERGKLQNELARIQQDIHKETTKLLVAEARSDHWLTANWRPLCATSLVGLIVIGSFGFITVQPEIYELANVFLSMYAGSRGLEKVGSILKGSRK